MKSVYPLAVAVAICLSGCFYQSVSETDIINAQKICGKDNLNNIQSTMFGQEYVECKTTEFFLINEKNINKTNKKD